MKNFSKVLVSAVLLGSFGFTAIAHAASAGMSLSPTGGTKNVGTSFSVGIYENSGDEPVNVAEASLGFDASQLSLTGLRCGGGFEIAASVSGSSLSCGTVTPKTGSQLVGTATFRVLAGSGSGAVSITSGAVYSANTNSNIAGGMSGANFNFATPAPVVVTPAPTPEPTPIPAPVQEKLYTVSVKVVDHRGDAVKGATVQFYGKTATTDRNGRVSVTGVKAGTYDVAATHNNLKVSAKVTVNAKNKSTQNFMVELPRAKRGMFGTVLGAGAGIALIGGGYALTRKRTTAPEATKKTVKKASVKPVARLATAKR